MSETTHAEILTAAEVKNTVEVINRAMDEIDHLRAQLAAQDAQLAEVRQDRDGWNRVANLTQIRADKAEQRLTDTVAWLKEAAVDLDAVQLPPLVRIAFVLARLVPATETK